MAKNDEQGNKAAVERARRQQQQREGAAALDQSQKNEAGKTDEQRAVEEAEALQQAEAKRLEESERAAAEQKAADDELARIEAEAVANAGAKDESAVDFAETVAPPLLSDARLLAPGTVVHLNGIPCEVVGDAALRSSHFADEQHFAAVLAQNQANLSLNEKRLRLVYSPMNGTVLPLADQRLTLEEMTDQERALFEAPPRPKK